MKNILIPTDFSIKSLKLVSIVAEHFPNKELNIILVHALEPDSSISGMLMLSKRLKVNTLCSDEFRDACEVLRNKYASTIVKIKIEFYFGTSRFYRNNYLNARQIDLIVFPTDYVLAAPSKHSVDMGKLFSNSGYPVLRHNLNVSKSKSFADDNSLVALLQA